MITSLLHTKVLGILSYRKVLEVLPAVHYSLLPPRLEGVLVIVAFCLLPLGYAAVAVVSIPIKDEACDITTTVF